jgi:2',3'-cyclic-nucleotide 2'-phosphodiesterase (5'-nucleotidase family)
MYGMARRFAAIVAAAVLGTAGLGYDRFEAQAKRDPARRVILSIVGTNDVHGGVLPSDGRGGLALLAGYVNNLRAARAKDGGAVLLLDAGDMWQGTLESNLTEGASVVAAYNAIGYTAAAVGNHEFDFGPVGPSATPIAATDDPRGALKARAAEARFPLLAANLIDASTGRPVVWPNVQPSVVVEAAGIKVGLVGVMTAGALAQTIGANTVGLAIAPLAGSIAAEARRLRNGGATVIIVTAHAGGECTRFDNPVNLSSCDLQAEIVGVARQLPRGLVDVIIAGHVHEGMAHEIAGIAITSAYSGGYAFGRVDLEIDPTSGTILRRRIFAPRQLCERENPRTSTCDPADARRLDAVSRYEGLPIRADPRIAAVLAPAIEKTTALKATSLGVTLETPLNRNGRIESALGNLVVDALRESIAGADAAMFNVRGGLRADLPAGPLTYGQLFAVIPFDNRVTTLQLTGGEVARVAAAQLQANPPRLGISGLRVRAACAKGLLSITLERSTGRRIATDERLRVATVDFLAFGGNEILTPIMPKGGFPVPSDAPIARDLIADWLRKRGGRLGAEQLIDAANPRWVYPGSLPLRCGR